jgi:hypothetical protein
MLEVEYLGFKIGVKHGTDQLKIITTTQPPQDVAGVK